MKFNDILMTSKQDTLLRLHFSFGGVNFKSEHYPEYFLDKADDLIFNAKVIDIGLSNNAIDIYLG